jgi:glucose/mannose-6-phosphate isomerase
MGAAIAGLPEQLREGAAIGAAAGALLRRPSAIVFAGMGGSAIAGELLRGLIADTCPVPITRVRSFGVPKWAGPGTLVVCVSYSGDTAETLACARQAQSQGAAILAVTAGGMLARHAEEFEQPLARVPAVITGKPRAALGLLFGATASAFAEAGLAPPGLAEQAAAGAAAADAEEARELGLRLSETVPLVYGFGPLAIVAYRWKTQLNENAKMPAFSHAFPEFAHNEIVGWAGSGATPFAAVLLREADQPPRQRALMDAASELISGDAALIEDVSARGSSAAEQAFSLVSHGDWVSYHAALARGVDPIPIDRIEALKSRLDAWRADPA